MCSASIASIWAMIDDNNGIEMNLFMGISWDIHGIYWGFHGNHKLW